jgi:hypothetical protein
MAFLSLTFIPLIIAIGFFVFSKNQVTLKEFSLHVFIQGLIAGLSILIIYHNNVSDTEILNGKIVAKERTKVSCNHSYSCNCYDSCTGSGKDVSCTQVCSTCYEHSYDISWRVKTDLKNVFDIERVDRQGLKEPPRFTEVVIGEPYSKSHSFDNYIKGSPDTLFRHQGLVEKYKDLIPKYPSDIYDYYRINRLVVVNGTINNAKDWNLKLSEINSDLGNKKQVNIGVVVVYNQPHDYFYALDQSWRGGKKNDAIPVIGVDSENNIQWIEVLAWVQDPIFKVKLRDSLLELKVLGLEKAIPIISSNVDQYFQRKPMKDFAYYWNIELHWSGMVF